MARHFFNYNLSTITENLTVEDGFEKKKRKLLSVGLFHKGTISKRWIPCGKPSCKCHTDKKKRHGPYYWWTTKVKGKTKAIYVREESLVEAKSYIKNYQELKSIIFELSQLSERIIRKKLKIRKKSQI